MNEFRRAFAVTFAVIILVLASVLALELINENISKSGFSSGEVLVLELEDEVFSGEILGRKFAFDLSPLTQIVPVLKKGIFLLSPCSRLLIWVLTAVFS